MTDTVQRQTVRWLLVPVLFLLPLTAVFIQLLGFKRLHHTAGRMAGMLARWAPPPADPLRKARQIARTVTVCNRRLSFYPASCLTESLLLWTMLLSCGIDARLILGVRTITGPLDAHAWVAFRHAVLNDIPNVQHIYATFDLGRLTSGAKPK